MHNGLRERYAERGPEPVGDAELVALVLGTGVRGQTAVVVAQRLLARFGGVAGLGCAEIAELACVHGVGPARAIRLHAAVQLGRRALRSPHVGRVVRSPEDAMAVLSPCLAGLADEELHGLFLDRRRRIVAHRMLTRGSAAFTIVDPRQIFRVALKVSASAVILAHNHPSGDPTPSAMDRDITERVARAGRVIGVPLLDHLVIAGSRHTSLAAEGAVPCHPAELPLWTP